MVPPLALSLSTALLAQSSWSPETQRLPDTPTYTVASTHSCSRSQNLISPRKIGKLMLTGDCNGGCSALRSSGSCGRVILLLLSKGGEVVWVTPTRKLMPVLCLKGLNLVLTYSSVSVFFSSSRRLSKWVGVFEKEKGYLDGT